MTETDLITTTQAGQLLGVTRQRVNMLSRRRSDFPKPALELPNTFGGVAARWWHRAEIEEWNATADRSDGPKGLKPMPRERRTA